MLSPAPRVCVVDDDESVRRALRRLLLSLSYAPILFASGEEFLAEARIISFEFVLLDLHMKGLNGVEVLKALKTIDCLSPVFMMTAFDQPDIRAVCLNEGAQELLRKPIGRDAIGLLLGRPDPRL